MKILERIIEKTTSGQWLLTVIGGFVFAYIAVEKILPPEATSAILSSIFTYYFTKSRNERNKNEETANNTANSGGN